MIENEIWKDIIGYEGLYQVSNYGEVKSLDRIDVISDGRKFHRKGKLLAHKICRKGYHRVQLCLNHKGKHCNIHRLVAITFIPNPNNLPQVNHIDGNKSNNTINNLEWISNADNFKHALENKLLNLDSTKRTINQYDMNGNFIKSYSSTLQAQAETGIWHTGISMCARGKYKHSKGYIWRYVD